MHSTQVSEPRGGSSELTLDCYGNAVVGHSNLPCLHDMASLAVEIPGTSYSECGREASHHNFAECLPKVSDFPGSHYFVRHNFDCSLPSIRFRLRHECACIWLKDCRRVLRLEYLNPFG